MQKAIVYSFLFLYNFSFAQCDYTLTGKVIDHHDRTALEFAEIFIKELKRGALTDSLGNYSIKNICAGMYTISCYHMGCDSVVELVHVEGNTNQNFYPEHHLHELGLINVVVVRDPEKNTSPINELKGKELDKTRGVSLAEALKTISGVNVIQTGSTISKPVIHGLHGNRILILNNGIRQESQQWGSEHAPEIDPFIANKLTVVKGANGVRYGSDAIAGVILVEPNKLRDSAGIGAELNLVGMSNGRGGAISAIVEQNFKKISALSWRLQGTFKKTGNIETPKYILKNTGVEENNFSATLGWNKKRYGVEVFYSQFNTSVGVFSGAHIGNVTDLMNAIDRPEPIEKAEFTYKIDRPYQHIEHELFKASAYLFTGDIGKLSFIYARQYNLRNEFDKHKSRNDSIAALNRPELHYEITSHTADVVWEHHSIKRMTGTIGISGMKQSNTYQGRYFIPNFRNYTGGVYIIERYTINKFQIEAGIRYDYRFLQIYKYVNNVIISPKYNYENTSGTIGTIYKFNSKSVISLNAGTAWRAPNVNELHSKGIHHGNATYEIGNENLKTEKAYNLIANYSFVENKKWMIDASVYYKRIKDFIYLKPKFPATVTISGAFPTFEYTQTDAALTGMDLNLSYNLIPQLVISEKISILRAKDIKTNNYLVQMPADRFTTELTYNFKNRKVLNESYITLGGMYENKQWRLPENSDYAPAPKAYFLLNAEIGTTIQIKNQRVVLAIGGTNLLNTTYRNYMNRFRYYADEMGRNIILRLKIPMNYSPKH